MALLIVHVHFAAIRALGIALANRGRTPRMFGTEYNWLISLESHPADGAPKARVTGGGMLTLAVALFCFVCVTLFGG